MKTLIGIKEVLPFRLADITVEKDNCFETMNGIIAHNSMYPVTILSGGTGQFYSANSIFIIGRRQDKNGKDIEGWDFIINIEKSRTTKEKSKIPITVKTEAGIMKWSGLFEIALDGGYIKKINNMSYEVIDLETGEVLYEKMKKSSLKNNSVVWNKLLKETKFPEYIKHKFLVANGSIINDEDNFSVEDEDIKELLES